MNEYNPIEIGKRIEAARKEKGFPSQKAFAKEIGIAQQSLDQIEKGITNHPRNLKEIAMALGKTEKWVLFGDEEDNQKIRIPKINWSQIPEIHDNPEKIKDLANDFITFKYEKEKPLFATKIPDSKIPGLNFGIFNPQDDLLINLKEKLKHSVPVLIYKNTWPEPEYAIYWKKGDQGYLKFPDNRLILLTDDIKVCGIIVARLNIFI